MKHRRFLAMLLTVAMMLSVLILPAAAEESEGGGVLTSSEEEEAEETQQLYVGWVSWSSDDDGWYFDPADGDWSTWYTTLPFWEDAIVFFTAELDEDGNLLTDTVSYVNPDELEMDFPLSIEAFEDTDEWNCVDSDDEAYFVHVCSTDDTDAWEQEISFTWTDADGTVYVLEGLISLGNLGVVPLTEPEYSWEYFVDVVADEGTLYYNGSEDDIYTFYLMADPDSDGSYTISNVTIREYEDYITAEKVSDQLWTITVDPAVFEETSYEDACLYFRVEYSYYNEVLDADGNVEWIDEWDAAGNCYLTLRWTGYRLGVRWLDWLSTDDGEGEGYYVNMSEEDGSYYVDSSAGCVYPGNEDAFIFYVYQTDTDGNLTYYEAVDPADLTWDDGLTVTSMVGLDGWDIAEGAEDYEYYVVVSTDDWSAEYNVYYDGLSTYIDSYVNSCEWYSSDAYGDPDALAEYTTTTPAVESTRSVYLGQYYASSHGEYTFLPVVSDDAGNWLFYVAEDGSLEPAYDEDDVDADWLAEWTEYYDSYFTFEWATNDAGTGLKISLTDEAIDSGFSGNVWISINWVNEDDYQWTWGTWGWYFRVGAQVLYAETDVLGEGVYDWADLDDATLAALQTSVDVGDSGELTGYLYILDWFTQTDEDGNSELYWQIASIDGLNDYWYGGDLAFVADETAELTQNADGSWTLSASEAGTYHISCNYGDYFRPMIVTTTAGAQTTSTISFTDVDADAYYAEAVAWGTAQGVIQGTSATTFSPDVTLNRAQLVLMLYRLAGEPDVTGLETPFTDIDGADVSIYHDAIVWAYNAGVTTGATDTTFGPFDTVTRAQTVTFLYRYYGEPETAGSASQFTDVASGAYYEEAVAWAVENNVTTGATTTTFAPYQSATRAQFVTFLYRAET